MSPVAARKDIALGCSPVVTLRLLAMADEAKSTLVDEPEQLVLPLEWAWSVPRPVEVKVEPARSLPDAKQWGGRITQASFEIMLGSRPAGQLARLVDARTLHVLALHTSKYSIARRRRSGSVLPRPRISSIRCYQPHPEAAEISAVVHDGERYRAVAIRLNARGNQWLATAFEMG